MSGQSGEESDDELLLRNVNDLKKRLLQTEKSLQLLQSPKTKKSYNGQKSRGKSAYSRYYSTPNNDSENDSMQPLTLDELTFDPNDTSTDSADHERRHSAASTSRGYQSYSKAVHTSSSRTNKSGSSDSLKRKLEALQDENSLLKNDRHRLQNKMESTEYQLKAAKKQIQSLSEELETGHGSPLVLQEKLANLESEVSAQDETLRDAEDRLEECQVHLSEKESSVKQQREELRNCKADLMHEVQTRQRMESQRDKALHNLEELNDHLTEFRTKTKEKFKKHQDIEAHLNDSLLHCNKEREELLEKCTSLEAEMQDTRQHVRRLEELSYTNSTLQAANHTLQASLKNHQQDLKALEDEVHSKTSNNQQLQKSMADYSKQLSQREQEVESKTKENDDLQRVLSTQRQQKERLEDELASKTRENEELGELTEIQNERLGECQREVEESREELRRMEDVASRLQQKQKFYTNDDQSSNQSHKAVVGSPLHTSSPHGTPGQARNLNSGSWVEESDYGSGSSNSSKAVISELRMKLALKEAEIHKMEAARQRNTAGCEVEEDTILSGLKLEITAIIRNNKIGDKKAQELEGFINQLEKTHNKQTYKIMEMQQQMTDEESHSAKLQSQVQHCSLQIRELQREISEKSRAVEDLETQFEHKTNQVSALEDQLTEKDATEGELVADIASLKEDIQNKETQLRQFKSELENKTKTCEDATQKLTDMKSLHSKQCKELQLQIELLQEGSNEKMRQFGEDKRKLEKKLDDRLQLIAGLEKTIQDKQQETNAKVSVQNQHLHSLQQKAEDASSRVANLEAALLVCKEELTMYIEQLEETKDRHEFEMESRNDKVGKLERELQQLHHNVEEKQIEILELEQALHQRQQMLQQSTGRITELEEREGHITQQVSYLERQLSQIKSSSEQDAEAMEKKLHQACIGLADRTAKLNDATKKFGEYKSKLTDATNELSELKKQLSHSKTDAKNNTSKIAQLELEIMQTKVKLQSKTERAKESENKFIETNDELQQARNQIGDQDVELTRAQEDLRAAVAQMTELQRLLQRSKAESTERHKRVQELTGNLKRVQEEIVNHEHELSEMDSALRISHAELDNRSAQVSQLDSAVKERQARMEQQIQDLESRLSQGQDELRQCTRQMSDLDDQCKHQQGIIKDKNIEIKQLEQIGQAQTNEMRQKTRNVDELEQQIQDLRHRVQDQKCEELEQGQQLRLVKEQMQVKEGQWKETRLKVTQLEMERDQMSKELENAMELANRKDTEKARLAEQLGQLRALETDNEAQFKSELLHIKKAQEKESLVKEKQISLLQNNHAELIASGNQTETSTRLEMKRLRKSESNLQREVEVLRERLMDMEHELLARKEVVEAANEAIVIKEAEVARLNARISGYERAAFGTQLTPSRETSSKFNCSLESPSLMLFSNNHNEEASPRTSLRRSISDAHLARTSALIDPMSGYHIDGYQRRLTNAPNDSLLGYHIDGYDRRFSRDSIGHRESFDRIFRVPDFPLDNKLFNKKPGGVHPTNTGYFNQSVISNENDYHRYVNNNGESVEDLAQTSPPDHLHGIDDIRTREDHMVQTVSSDRLHGIDDIRTRQDHMVQAVCSQIRHDSNSAIQRQRPCQNQPSSVSNQQRSQDIQHASDLESVDGENLNSLQNMLTYVNKQIAEEDRRDGVLDPTMMSLNLQQSPSFAPLPDTPEKASPSSTPGKTQIRKTKASPKRRGIIESPSSTKKTVSNGAGRDVTRTSAVGRNTARQGARTLAAVGRGGARMSAAKGNGATRSNARGGGTSSAGRGGGTSSAGRGGGTSSVKPKILSASGKSGSQGDNYSSSSPQTTPLKQKLAKQRNKMAAAQQKLKPLDCMVDLHDKLKASDERRRQIDQQLFGL